VLKKKSFYTEVHFLVLYHSDFKIIRVSGPINYSEYDDSDDDDPPTFIAIIIWVENTNFLELCVSVTEWLTCELWN
jgi:hypothetical protein